MSDLPYIAYSHGNNNTLELGDQDGSEDEGVLHLFDASLAGFVPIRVSNEQLIVNNKTIEVLLRNLITQNTGRGPLDGELIAYRASTNNLIWSAGGGGGGGGVSYTPSLNFSDSRNSMYIGAIL